MLGSIKQISNEEFKYETTIANGHTYYVVVTGEGGAPGY
jgi:hypothetical protein